MKTWKLLPSTETIAQYVECYWFLEKEADDQSFSYPKLNPDPSAHLIIANSQNTFEYTAGHKQLVAGSHWIFPHLNTFTMDHSAAFGILGIKFKVGALYSLTLGDGGSQLDKVVQVDLARLIALEGVTPDELLIMAAEQKEQTGHLLDKALLPWVSNCHEDKHSALVRQVLLLLGNTAIAEMGEKLHRSQRTVERSFMRVTDLSMKQAQSMIQLEELLNYVYSLDNAAIQWADIANQFGFADQPHLIRHLKQSIGNTPAKYAQERDLTIDIYGNFELD